MKRILVCLMTVLLLLTACGQNTIISSQGTVTPPERHHQSDFPPEYPDALQSFPADVSSREGSPSSSKAPASSSKTPASSSKAPASSSKAPASSSKAPTSSSKAPASSSKAPAKAPADKEQEAVEMPNLPTAPTAAKPSTATTPKEVRAVWVSYLEFLTLAKNQTCASFTNNIGGVFSRAADYGLNTIMVQVRPFGDALYRSEYFPWSYVLTGEEGVDPGYDPLAVMVEQAQKYGLRIEAWINPYRIRTSSARAIGDANPAKGYLVSGSDAVIQYKGGTYYNPASTTARNLITAGAVEIVKNYDIDAIHFDDYFYPTTDAAFDAADYKAYQNSGGRLALSDWRRDNVNTLVKQVHMAIRSADSGVQFGISPQARMDVNYNAQYADVKTWVSNGWVDYICPQIYFGFEHSTVPYSQALATWSEMTRGTGVGLYIGLAAYKCGVADGGAGNAKNEWIDSDDLLEKMVAEARKESTYAGFALYRYDSIFAPVAAVSGHITQERENLASIL